MKSLHRRQQLGLVSDEIEPALRRDFLAFFRNETDFIRHDAQREVDDLGVFPISRLSFVTSVSRKRSISRS